MCEWGHRLGDHWGGPWWAQRAQRKSVFGICQRNLVEHLKSLRDEHSHHPSRQVSRCHNEDEGLILHQVDLPSSCHAVQRAGSWFPGQHWLPGAFSSNSISCILIKAARVPVGLKIQRRLPQTALLPTGGDSPHGGRPQLSPLCSSEVLSMTGIDHSGVRSGRQEAVFALLVLKLARV